MSDSKDQQGQPHDAFMSPTEAISTQGAINIKYLYFLMCALLKHKDTNFETSVAYTIPDHDGTLFYTLIDTPGAYVRKSSHLRSQGVGQEPRGLELCSSIKHGDNEFTTLLVQAFQINGKRYLFLKPERVGCDTLCNTMWHALDYVTTVCTKYTDSGHDNKNQSEKLNILHARNIGAPADTPYVYASAYSHNRLQEAIKTIAPHAMPQLFHWRLGREVQVTSEEFAEMQRIARISSMK